LTNPAVFTSDVQSVHTAAGRHIQAGDATDQQCDKTLSEANCHSDISQGSVATHFRCGGIFIDIILQNF